MDLKEISNKIEDFINDHYSTILAVSAVSFEIICVSMMHGYHRRCEKAFIDKLKDIAILVER